ncbi:MAG: FkbM family methyltransferase [Fluviicola sp.]|nr:FkbM family methyltransferase [Fluviicola sp.]
MKKIRLLFKPLYDAIPFKNKLFSFIRFFGYKGKLTKFLYFDGDFSFQLNGKKVKMYNPGYQSHIENQIFWNGIENGWERNSVRIWNELSKKAKVIVDVGANTGIFTLLSLKINENTRVISFEPMDFISEKFKRNMKLNNLKYELYDFALSDVESTVDVYSESKNNSYTIAIDNNNLKGEVKDYFKLEMKTKRLDSFIEENKIDRIDLMKIDVERHEPMVLEGMGKYLEIMKPDILIEIQTTEIADKIQELVKNVDYLFFNINDLGDVRQTEKIEQSDYLNYLLCSKESAKLLNLTK